MVLFDTTSLTVALPDLQRDLHGGVQGLAWVTDAYTLSFAACLLGAGVIADRRGARSVFTRGLAAFGALTALRRGTVNPDLGRGTRAARGCGSRAPALLAIAHRRALHRAPTTTRGYRSLGLNRR